MPSGDRRNQLNDWQRTDTGAKFYESLTIYFHTIILSYFETFVVLLFRVQTPKTIKNKKGSQFMKSFLLKSQMHAHLLCLK